VFDPPQRRHDRGTRVRMNTRRRPRPAGQHGLRRAVAAPPDAALPEDAAHVGDVYRLPTRHFDFHRRQRTLVPTGADDG
jgi:hypothetical protein